MSTSYPKNEAGIYDQKRFFDFSGQLFNKLEMRQLENLLCVFPPQQKILEVGCGTGRFVVKCLENGHNVFGLDSSIWMLKECIKKTTNLKKAKLFLAEGSRLPFGDNQFDFTYSIRTLNQVSSKLYALGVIHEMIRVTNKGGTMLIEFVNKQSLTIRRYRSVRLSVSDIRLIVGKYKNVKIESISGILFFPQSLMRLTPVLLLRIFERVDNVFSRIFPTFTTRCYIVLKKNK
jgi:ubiquinone/menaquinone biosynthesis C-methylase UbiE